MNNADNSNLVAVLSMRSDQEIMDQYWERKNLAQAIREGTQPRDYAFGTDFSPERFARDRENIRRFNESTRNRALLLAASKQLRIIYFLGSTLLLFVLTPLLWFAPPQLASHFGPSGWWLIAYIGAIIAPLCALRGYFIWARAHWYRWIGKGIKEDYEAGEVLQCSAPSRGSAAAHNEVPGAGCKYAPRRRPRWPAVEAAAASAIAKRHPSPPSQRIADRTRLLA